MDSERPRKDGKNWLRFLVVFAVAIAAAVPLWWLTASRRVIRFAWYVEGPAPLVVVVERENTGDGDYDAETLRVVELESGEVRGSMSVGDDWSGMEPTLFGPFGHRAWLATEPEGLCLLDLRQPRVEMDHAALRQKLGSRLGGDLQVSREALRFDHETSRLRIQGKDGSDWLIDPKLVLQPLPEAPTFRSLYDACASALEKAKANAKLLEPDLRGCYGAGADRFGFVQHASAAFGDKTFRGTLFDSAGNIKWTAEASGLAGQGSAWFAKAVPHGEALLLLVVAGRNLFAVYVDQATGNPRKTQKLL